MSKAFEIRTASGRDLGFIYDTWLKSFQCDSRVGKSCHRSVFFREYKLVIDRLLSLPTTTVLVAHSPDNENHIHAYLAFEPGVIHYAFCKEPLRRFGITKALFLKAFGPEASADTSHKTFTAKEIFDKHPNLTHNPFSLYLKGAV